MRQYTLKQVVVQAGDIEQSTAGVPGEPEVDHGEEHVEEKVEEHTTDTRDGTTDKNLEGETICRG